MHHQWCRQHLLSKPNPDPDLCCMQVANNTVRSNRGRGAILKSSNGVVLGNSFKLTAFQVAADFQFLEVSLQVYGTCRLYNLHDASGPTPAAMHSLSICRDMPCLLDLLFAFTCANTSCMPVSKPPMYCRLTL